MELTLAFFALAVPAVVFAGLSKGGFGSGAAFASTPLLALVMEPALAVGLMLPLLMAIDLGILRPYWRKWHWPSARVIILGSLPGAGLGMLLYGIADPDVFRVLIGLVAVLFVAEKAARKAGLIPLNPRPMGPLAGGICGAGAGLTSFIAHAGGPPVAIYLLSQGLTKTSFQATTVIIFWAINIVKVVPYAALGMFTGQTMLAGVALLPAALLGAWLGVRAHRVVPEKLFFGLTYTLLVITGSKLIWDGLT